jgi:hypothetical protein
MELSVSTLLYLPVMLSARQWKKKYHFEGGGMTRISKVKGG